MHRSLVPATFACLLTTVALVVAPISAQNKLYTFLGDSAYDVFGRSVAGAGDVNKDGYDDVIVGAHIGPTNWGSGRAWVLSGVDGSILYTFLGDSVRDVFGSDRVKVSSGQ